MNEKRAQNPWITCGKLLKWRLYIHLSMHVRWATVCSSQKHFYYLQPNLDIWCSLFCWINPTFKPIHLCVASDTVYGYSQWSHQCYIFFIQMPTHFRPYHSVLFILILAVIGWINGFRRACFKCMRPTNLRLRVQSGFFYFHLIMTLTFAKRMDGCYPCKQTSTPPSPQPIRLGKRLFLYRPFHFFTFFIFYTTNMCDMFLI